MEAVPAVSKNSISWGSPRTNLEMDASRVESFRASEAYESLPTSAPKKALALVVRDYGNSNSNRHARQQWRVSSTTVADRSIVSRHRLISFTRKVISLGTPCNHAVAESVQTEAKCPGRSHPLSNC